MRRKMGCVEIELNNVGIRKAMKTKNRRRSYNIMAARLEMTRKWSQISKHVYQFKADEVGNEPKVSRNFHDWSIYCRTAVLLVLARRR